MKEKNLKLSKLEINVMGPFWAHSELTIREAADQLAQTDNDPGYSTVQTIAGRLEKKGAIAKTSKIGKSWLFRAAIEKSQVVGRLMDELLGILDGASSPILSHLVDSEKLGKSELEEIRKMIEQREEKEDEK